MKTCNRGHEPIAYEGEGNCPFCDKIDEMQEEIDNIDRQKDELQNRLEAIQ